MWLVGALKYTTRQNVYWDWKIIGNHFQATVSVLQVVEYSTLRTKLRWVWALVGILKLDVEIWTLSFKISYIFYHTNMIMCWKKIFLNFFLKKMTVGIFEISKFDRYNFFLKKIWKFSFKWFYRQIRLRFFICCVFKYIFRSEKPI